MNSPHRPTPDRSPKQTLRRDFAKSAVVGAIAGCSLPRISKGLHAAEKAPTRLRVAFIGVGGRGGGNLASVTKDPGVEAVAICDVDQRRLDAAQKLHPDARQYTDYRKLYEHADDIDAVVVSVPEHSHAFATMPALKLGKHVYCEKPLTHNIAESRAITLAAEQAGVATQMGTQIHANANYHRVVELIQSGAIGDVHETHVWVGRAWGLQNEAYAKQHGDIVYVTEQPSQKMKPPEFLDWDLWLGPAPWRPYHEVYFPGPKWYRWWDFGSGTMSDLGSHWNDLPFWALNLDAPLSVTADGPPPHAELAPASMSATYEYGPRGAMPACRLTWYQGALKPELWEMGKIPQWNSGALFIGSEGMLLSDYGKHLLLPEDQFQNFVPPPETLPVPVSHHQEWLDACRHGTPTGSPFSYAGPLTEANHLGNVAYRTGAPIEWDAKAMRVTNVEAANRFVSRQPRDGWKLEDL
ncbi:Gfo/Idh/MocA family protein [Aureliella helgolandensis]|uniref:Inositol 2-dehydrogenase n=1 Tax=Aureliella helgolandensis TaxID=2527968 RepID=A0A518G7M9_9BACT|nr:Gfo/Idh/MocA family oxidoreductase [Aureliella helgolandensis]QDV24589.1 Inositol 2-dehydrogenase [Aureliella helgolandensis]